MANHLKIPTTFAMHATRFDDHHLARIYNVTPETIRNWKRRAGMPLHGKARVDYDAVDKMLRDGVDPPAIAERLGYGLTTIARRRRQIYGKRREHKKYTKRDPDTTYSDDRGIQFIPPGARFSLAVERKAEILGMDKDQFMASWLPGSAGQTWLSDCGFA